MGWEKWLLSYHVHLLICSCGSQTFSVQGPPKHKWDHGPQFDWALSQGPPSEKSFTIRSVCLSVCQPISLYCSSCIHYYAIFLRLRFFFNINYKPIKCHNCIFHGCVKLSCWQNLPTDIWPDIWTPSEILQNTFVIIPGPHFPIMTRTQNTQGEALTANAVTVGNECVI